MRRGSNPRSMGLPFGGAGTGPRNPLFSAVASRRRRLIVALLLDRTSPVREEELATHLVAAERGTSLLDVTDEDVRPLRTDLPHVQLPALEDAGLVEWDREAATVGTTNHPVLRDPKFERVLGTEAEGWDDVLANLAYRRRRVVLSVLTDRDGPTTRAALARAVAARETGGDAAPDAETVEALRVSLHHVHLPKLRGAGLVAYDGEGVVSYEGHPALDDEWLDSRADEAPRAILPTASQADDVWTIRGRDNVIARGQSLFEQADEELFLMFTTDGLLEDGCVRRLRDAVDRGVDVYVGSQTPEVRDLVRERVPGAVIWEPQMDWLNLPPRYERVGRLVFADREAIMLATLGERTEAGVHRETAITGAGGNNAVVVLLRELLGSRLDHLDAQGEDFLSELPL